MIDSRQGLLTVRVRDGLTAKDLATLLSDLDLAYSRFSAYLKISDNFDNRIVEYMRDVRFSEYHVSPYWRYQFNLQGESQFEPIIAAAKRERGELRIKSLIIQSPGLIELLASAPVLALIGMIYVQHKKSKDERLKIESEERKAKDLNATTRHGIDSKERTENRKIAADLYKHYVDRESFFTEAAPGHPTEQFIEEMLEQPYKKIEGMAGNNRIEDISASELETEDEQ